MKILRFSHAKLLMIGIACSLAASATIDAGALSSRGYGTRDSDVFNGNARLVIRRAADFGSIIYLHLFIDGVQVTTLGRNEGYEAIVRPGSHVLSITTTPSAHGKTRVTYRNVAMQGGQTYAFTALWVEADLASLEEPDHAPRAYLVPDRR